MRMAISTTKRVYVVGRSGLSTLAEAAAEFTRILGFTTPWNGDLNAYDDFLKGVDSAHRMRGLSSFGDSPTSRESDLITMRGCPGPRGFVAVFKHISGFEFSLLLNTIHARPIASNASRWVA
jgi:hypothetical protein